MSDKELMWAAALRYSLGRRTYMPSVVCEWFKTHKLSKNLIQTSITDITRNEECNNLGDDCDKLLWLSLKEYLQNKLEE